ncbi:50S ribosomal protein L11 [Candidatus Micrarchaeota archaeon CG1_02_47_40]|nr:MAG: 50S ribosomal protein L11 [Candidatus Micrarchaeota archaeon CG1_02_47_40]
MGKATIDAIVEGGKASAGPPLGPALGPMGVNIAQVIAKINEQTKNFAGLKVPVKVIIDTAAKTYEVEVGSPPTGELIKGELKIEKGRKEKGQIAGNLSIEQAIKIAKMKDTLSKSLKGKVKEVLGTCVSLGVTCEGRDAKKIIGEVNAGNYDSKLAGG